MLRMTLQLKKVVAYCGTYASKVLAVIEHSPFLTNPTRNIAEMSTRPCVARNVYFIKQNDNGVWVSGTIISDSSVYVVSLAEDDQARVFTAAVVVVIRLATCISCCGLCVNQHANVVVRGACSVLDIHRDE